MTNPQDKTQGMAGSQHKSGEQLSDKAKSQDQNQSYAGQRDQITQGVDEDDVSFEKRRQAQIDEDLTGDPDNSKTGSTSHQPS